MSHEHFEELLNQLVSKHLDAVLRKNRDQMRLAFATTGKRNAVANPLTRFRREA